MGCWHVRSVRVGPRLPFIDQELPCAPPCWGSLAGDPLCQASVREMPSVPRPPALLPPSPTALPAAAPKALSTSPVLGLPQDSVPGPVIAMGPRPDSELTEGHLPWMSLSPGVSKSSRLFSCFVSQKNGLLQMMTVPRALVPRPALCLDFVCPLLDFVPLGRGVTLSWPPWLSPV